MKNIFQPIILLAALLAAACAPEMTIDTSSLNATGGGTLTAVSDELLEAVIPSSGGTVSFTFTVNNDWTAELINDRADSWLYFGPTKGKKGTVKMAVSVQPNDSYDERSASIILKSDELTRTIRITQKQLDAVLVSASSLNVGEEGGTISLEIKANIPYTFRIDPSCLDWVRETSTKALNSRTLTFEISPNESFDRREGAILISNSIASGAVSETVRIYQDGATPRIILTKSEYVVSDKGEEITVEVRSNVNVKYSISEGWVSEVATKAMSTNTFVFSVEPNTSYDERTAAINFICSEKNLSETVSIIQMQKDAIVASPDIFSIESEGGDFSVKLGHNVDFTTSIDVPWITPVTTKGFVTDVLTFNIAENTSGAARDGCITFTSADNALSQKVIVKQASNLVPLTDIVGYGIYDISGDKPAPILIVDETCQYVCSTRKDGRMFRIQSFNGGYLTRISFPGSVSEGSFIQINVSPIGIDLPAEGAIDVEVQKISGQDIWLADESRNIGFIIAMED